MRYWNGLGAVKAALAAAVIQTIFVQFSLADAVAESVTEPGTTVAGEKLDAAALGPGIIESMDAVRLRDLYAPRALPKGRNGRPGAWAVPSLGATLTPHSGRHHVVNKWGDTRMGIGFPDPVDVLGAWFAAGDNGSGTPSLRAVGFRAGEAVTETDWWAVPIGAPEFLEMNFHGVDRIEIIATPVVEGSGWYALDDLTYLPAGASTADKVVVGFEELGYGVVLTGTGYAGLTWEAGAGVFPDTEGVHAPKSLPLPSEPGREGEAAEPSGTRAATPALLSQFQGVIRGDSGSSSYPPDTCGAIGPAHFVVAVNRNVAAFNRTTGARVYNQTLGGFNGFLPGSDGDPRVLFDHHSQRWIIIASDFNTRVYLAVSLTNDPTGSWFKTSIVVSTGDDSGRWPDYPTLGVDANGIYCAAYMVDGPGMSIFAIDKAPLVAPSPSLGTVTAFRNLPFAGAIQPALTFGTPVGEYLVSQGSGNSLKVRRVNPPLTNPTLTDLGNIAVASFSSPPDAPALGSSTNLDTVGPRPMMALFRNNRLWTCHTIAVNGRAACRWYELNPGGMNVVQYGNVASSTLHYFFPSLMVNNAGSVVMGFTGSSASQYPAAYYTGRLASDTPGQMATPVLYRAGNGSQNNLDQYGRNRWGDYSYTSLDPTDGIKFWTIQEYAHNVDIWGTHVAQLTLGDGDCNGNGTPDYQDISAGTSPDCNANGLPDECDLAAGTSPDCNANSIPDECDLAGGTPDCNANGVPDSCDLAGGAPDCNLNGIPDECDLAGGVPDCDGNSVPDVCDLSAGRAADCNANGVPDACDVALHTSADCNDNGLPDECEADTRQGLAGAYYADMEFVGTPRSRLDPTVSYDWGAAAPWSDWDGDAFSARWTGFVHTLGAGTYTFFTRSDDGVRLRIAGQFLIDQWSDQLVTELSGSLSLAGDAYYPIVLEYYENAGPAVIELLWQPPGQAKAVIPAARLIPGRDCDDNGVLDACDLRAEYEAASPALTPLGGVTQTFTLTSPPEALGDVTLSFRALGDLNFSSENVAVDINGVAVGTIYEVPAIDCVADQVDQLVVPVATYNAARTASTLINMVPSSGVNPLQCTGSYIQVTIDYLAVGGADCNANGLLDGCDIAAGLSADANANGVPDECEAPTVCRGDADCDGTIGFGDIDYFVAAIPNNEAAWAAKFPGGTPPPGCTFANCDVDADGNVAFSDIDPFVAKIPSTCP